MDEQSKTAGPPPAARTAVATAVYCHAGRRLAHPVRSGWDHPCPTPGTEEFLLDDGTGAPIRLTLCSRHKAQLVADGLSPEVPR